MIAIPMRATRPMAIKRVWATGRVPFGLMPVTAAMPAMTTAIPSHANQFMIRPATRCGPGRGTWRQYGVTPGNSRAFWLLLASGTKLGQTSAGECVSLKAPCIIFGSQNAQETCRE